ncbi:MAG: substrate-binding domain-containing protein [Bryobacteraceae bacterium]
MGRKTRKSAAVNGVQPVLQAAGYSMFLATAGRSVEQEKTGLHAFVDHRVDGLLIATRGTQLGDEAILEITRQGVPVVTVGRPIHGSDVDRVTADHWRGAYDVVTHLIALGHKRIGFIGVAPADAPKLRRYHGYADALTQHGIQLREELVVGPAEGPGYASEEDGYAGMERLMKVPRRPTAVFARNDYAAMGALRAAHDLGLAIPEDVAIAGFDNLPMAAYTTPPLTTVSQPIVEQGLRAAEFLLDRIERRVKDGRRDISLDCKLIVRASTDSQAGRHGAAKPAAVRSTGGKS